MEDCCEPNNKQNTKGGKMETNRIILWVVIAILAIAVLYITFASGASAGTAQPVVQAASSGMVGGC